MRLRRLRRAGAMAAAGPAALASGAPAVPAAARGGAAAAASDAWGPPGRLRGSRPRPAPARPPPSGPPPAARELVQPSVSELSRAVRTNILCTVRGCGKILPNGPALNMHLVKSHRLQVSPACSHTPTRPPRTRPRARPRRWDRTLGPRRAPGTRRPRRRHAGAHAPGGHFSSALRGAGQPGLSSQEPPPLRSGSRAHTPKRALSGVMALWGVRI